ncbi:U3 small nucleolar ribonucleoprotein IMP3 [Perkinsela sp. CCAP 1560/4]|nr:U3 small nucleolar ribonucleoprotein IMP3 [Perkinsela sp. CCAP 1560/4]KNH05675.1 U3 small nucleolar ribonucleoprotein IMP3 [Perkinsela sp. CCAP 1560/4]|eukprot:KNH03949.1 U3 small nucleolar ribonucleoprotein IMP3 [Perkinsela sp. CCAP 1560/4]
MVNSVHRKLKHHEQRLLRKHDFLCYPKERKSHESIVIKKYGLTKREDYTYYNKLSGLVRSLVNHLRYLPKDSKVRLQVTEQLLQKLYQMGVTDSAQSLEVVEKITTSSFCRRRLPVMLTQLKFSPRVQTATELVMHGHFRVGPHQITDPAYLVPRRMEDHINWVRDSKVRAHVLRYNGSNQDDYVG